MYAAVLAFDISGAKSASKRRCSSAMVAACSPAAFAAFPAATRRSATREAAAARPASTARAASGSRASSSLNASSVVSRPPDLFA